MLKNLLSHATSNWEQILPSKLALIKLQTADSELLQQHLDLEKSEITDIFFVKWKKPATYLNIFSPFLEIIRIVNA